MYGRWDIQSFDLILTPTTPLIHFRRRIVPLGTLLIRRSLSLTSGARAILSSSATWLDRAVHPFASFGALTALFNPSNSETILIIPTLFVTYLHSLFLHPFFLHEGFFQHSLPRSTLALPAGHTPLTIPDLVKECLLMLLPPGSIPRTCTLGLRVNFLTNVHAYSLPGP